jgi:hypothetical protein
MVSGLRRRCQLGLLTLGVLILVSSAVPGCKRRAPAKPNAPAAGTAMKRMETAAAALESRLSGTYRLLCWQKSPNVWTCRDEHLSNAETTELGARRVVVTPHGQRCMQETSLEWRCSGMARRDLVGQAVEDRMLQPWSPSEFEARLYGFGGAALVRGNQWRVCGLLRGGVSCSGAGPAGELGGPTQAAYVDSVLRMAFSDWPVRVPETEGATDVVLIENGACALVQPEGKVLCWGMEESGWQAEPCSDSEGYPGHTALRCVPRSPRRISPLPPIRHLTAGNLRAITAVAKDGRVFYWVGAADTRPPAPIPGIQDARLVATEHIDTFCVARLSGVRCYQPAGLAHTPIEELDFGSSDFVDYPGLDSAVELVVSGGQPCVRKTDDSIWCAAEGGTRLKRLQ